MDEVDELLAEKSPLPLLQFTSGLIEITTPRLDRRLRGDDQPIDTSELLVSFVDSGFPQLIALARAGAVLHADEKLEARLRRTGSAAAKPSWLKAIGEIELDGCRVQQHVLGDGENLLVGWRWPGGAAATIVVYVDHNMGTIVKDAFVVDEDLASIEATYESMSEPGMTSASLDLADARARILQALDTYEHVLDAPETETWPVSRPLVEWIAGRLPGGGVGFSRPDWPEADRQALLDDFLASPHGLITGLTPGEVADLANPLVWFGCDYGPGDPLRWSPVSVEIVLADWYPRKVVGIPAETLRRLPDVLAGFIRYAHQRRHIPAESTVTTLEAVEYWQPELLDAITTRSTRSTPAAGLGQALLTADLDDETYMEEVVINLESTVIDLVGGAANYATLNDGPLDDMAFDWTGIPTTIRDHTAATMADLDRWAAELFDPEVRSIARAVLAKVVTTDPATFRRTTDTAGLAAAILGYLLKRLTGRFSRQERELLPWQTHTIKALSEATGVSASTISSRSKTVANVMDRSDINWSTILHSTQRREALETKQRVAEWRAART